MLSAEASGDNRKQSDLQYPGHLRRSMQITAHLLRSKNILHVMLALLNVKNSVSQKKERASSFQSVNCHPLQSQKLKDPSWINHYIRIYWKQVFTSDTCAANGILKCASTFSWSAKASTSLTLTGHQKILNVQHFH